MAERVIDVNIATQSNQDMRDYAIYVIRNRAIPDMIDGLKPVIRRIYFVLRMTSGVKDLSRLLISWVRLFVNIILMGIQL